MPTPRLGMREIGSIVGNPFNPASWSHERFAAAIHEAAHAVAAMALRYRVTSVHIEEKDDGRYQWTGRCEHVRYHESATPLGADVELSMIIAAPYAAMKYTDGMTREAEGFWDGMIASDHTRFARLHRELASDLGFHEWQNQCTRNAANLLEANPRGLEAITICLLQKGRVSEQDLRILAPAIATLWEEEDAAEPEHDSSWPVHFNSIPSPRQRPAAPGYRLGGAFIETRDIIPGLRYSDPAGITTDAQ